MKKKGLYGLSVSIGTALVVAVVSLIGACAPAAPEVLEAKLATTLPVTNFFTEAGDMFTELVNEGTEGRVHITHYPARQLLDPAAIVEAMPEGAIDFAFVDSPTASVIPEFMLVNTYLMFFSWEVTRKALKELDPMFQEAFARPEYNGKLLSWISYGDLGLMSKKTLTTMEDYKGLRCRSAGGAHNVTMAALGIAPVYMSSSDVYLALQRGTLDAGLSAPVSFWTRKWYEVADYMTARYTPFYFAVMCNMDFWNSLSKSDQKVTQEAADVIADWTYDWCQDARATLFADLQAAGVEFTDVSDEDAAQMTVLAAEAFREWFVERVGQDRTDELFKLLEEATGIPLR